MKRAEENIKHDLENCGDLHDFVKDTRTFNKIKIKNSTLKSMGYNGTFETLILETPTKPCFPQCGIIFLIHKKKLARNGIVLIMEWIR